MLRSPVCLALLLCVAFHVALASPSLQRLRGLTQPHSPHHRTQQINLPDVQLPDVDYTPTYPDSGTDTGYEDLLQGCAVGTIRCERGGECVNPIDCAKCDNPDQFFCIYSLTCVDSQEECKCPDLLPYACGNICLPSAAFCNEDGTPDYGGQDQSTGPIVYPSSSTGPIVYPSSSTGPIEYPSSSTAPPDNTYTSSPVYSSSSTGPNDEDIYGSGPRYPDIEAIHDYTDHAHLRFKQLIVAWVETNRNEYEAWLNSAKNEYQDGYIVEDTKVPPEDYTPPDDYVRPSDPCYEPHYYPNGYCRYGYDVNGYDPFGYDQSGFNAQGVSRYGVYNGNQFWRNGTLLYCQVLYDHYGRPLTNGDGMLRRFNWRGCDQQGYDQYGTYRDDCASVCPSDGAIERPEPPAEPPVFPDPFDPTVPDDYQPDQAGHDQSSSGVDDYRPPDAGSGGYVPPDYTTTSSDYVPPDDGYNPPTDDGYGHGHDTTSSSTAPQSGGQNQGSSSSSTAPPASSSSSSTAPNPGRSSSSSTGVSSSSSSSSSGGNDGSCPNGESTSEEVNGNARIYVRKPTSAMNPAEWQRFRNAWNALNQQGVIATYVNIHAQVFQQHNSNKFLPWHREFVARFEDELHRVDPCVTLPYWDFVAEPSLPVGISAPGFPPSVDGNAVTRAPGQSGSLPNAGFLVNVMNVNSYVTFTQRLEQFHNAAHVWVGGSMAFVAQAPRDPIFYMLHGYIDRLFHDWQTTVALPGEPSAAVIATINPLQFGTGGDRTFDDVDTIDQVDTVRGSGFRFV